MVEQESRTWREASARLKGPAVLAVAVVTFVLGAAGWKLTDPALDPFDAAYLSLALFAVSFAHEGPIHPLLNAARFLAVALVYWAAARIAVRVLSRRSTTRRAARLRDHVVVMGDAEEVRPIALRYRDAGQPVVVVGQLPAPDVERLARGSVLTVLEAADKDLRKILAGARRVIVAGRGEEGSAALADRVHRVAAGRPSLTVLFHDRYCAAQWARQHGDLALCRSSQLAIALLRSHPPFLETAMVPPPVVIGDGEIAAEIVRRIVTGWQQPGERITVHCLGRDPAWSDAARASLDDRADLRFDAVPSSATLVAAAVRRLVDDWPGPSRPDRFTVSGPTVYVAYGEVSLTVPLTSAVAEAVPDARVVGLVDDASTWIDTLSSSAARLVSRRALLTDPRTLELDPRRMLMAEIVADAGRWPADVPTALGRVARSGTGLATLEAQDAGVKDAVEAVATRAEAILAAGGVRLEQRGWAAEATFLLGPDQLHAVERALAQALGASDEGDVGEARLRRLELAARLPILAARCGWMPTLAEGALSPLGDAALRKLALLAHGGYESVMEASGNVTASDNFGKAWGELDEVDQRSNIAQVADIPVKLATLGLTWRLSPAPADFTFTEEQVEELAENEHRRWVHFQYRNGRPGHQWNKTWADLGKEAQRTGQDPRLHDRNAVRVIPTMLASLGLEIVPLQEAGSIRQPIHHEGEAGRP